MVQWSFGLRITLGGDTCASVPISNALLHVEEVEVEGVQERGRKDVSAGMSCIHLFVCRLSKYCI